MDLRRSSHRPRPTAVGRKPTTAAGHESLECRSDALLWAKKADAVAIANANSTAVIASAISCFDISSALHGRLAELSSQRDPARLIPGPKVSFASSALRWGTGPEGRADDHPYAA
jgi:hypothetical protein